MLKGDLVGLRHRAAEDVPVLRAQLYDDVATHDQLFARPWVPLDPDSPTGAFAAGDPRPDAIGFSIVALDSGKPDSGKVSLRALAAGELVGSCALHGIDTHHRSAEIGISLLPAFRGRGLALDTVRILIRYAFAGRGLHRLRIETIAGNAAMRATAEAAGFTLEGTLRDAVWLDGRFVDGVVYGLLAD